MSFDRGKRTHSRTFAGVNFSQLAAAIADARMYARWVHEFTLVTREAAGVGTIGRVFLFPIEVPVDLTIDRITVAYRATVAGNVRVGIYADAPAGDTPLAGVLQVESASVAKIGANRHHDIVVANTYLAKGLYWKAVQSDEVTTTFVEHAQYGTVPITRQPYYYDRVAGYGAFTDPCPAITAVGFSPIGYLRVYSIP